MKLKDHLTELIDGEPQYLGPGDDIWDKLDELGLLDAEVQECVVDDSDTAAPMQLVTPERHGLDLWGMGLRHNDRVRVIVVPLRE